MAKNSWAEEKAGIMIRDEPKPTLAEAIARARLLVTEIRDLSCSEALDIYRQARSGGNIILRCSFERQKTTTG